MYRPFVFTFQVSNLHHVVSQATSGYCNSGESIPEPSAEQQSSSSVSFFSLVCGNNLHLFILVKRFIWYQ